MLIINISIHDLKQDEFVKHKCPLIISILYSFPVGNAVFKYKEIPNFQR